MSSPEIGANAEPILGADTVVSRSGGLGRSSADLIYAVVVGGRRLEATGEHPFLTRRGWVEARHLTTRDEVARGQRKEYLRLRVRTNGDNAGAEGLSRHFTPGDAESNQRGQEAKQSDVRPEVAAKSSAHTDWVRVGRAISETRKRLFAEGKLTVPR